MEEHKEMTNQPTFKANAQKWKDKIAILPNPNPKP